MKRTTLPILHMFCLLPYCQGACVMTIHATHQGPFMGIPPTGREVRFMLLWIERIVDGTVIQHWALPDFLSLFQQIGATIQPTHASASGSVQQS